MRFITCILGLTLLWSCKTVNPNFDIEPTCLQEVVKNILEKEPAKRAAEIKQGLIDQRKVYLITDERQDQPYTVLLNDNCEYLCEMGDGFQTNNCPEDLIMNLKDVQLIWLDSR